MPKLRDNNHLLAKPKLPIGWVRRMIEGCHTQKEWQELIVNLPPQVQVQFLLASQPKEIKSEENHIVRLLIEGIQARPALTARHVDALEQHEEQVHDNTE